MGRAKLSPCTLSLFLLLVLCFFLTVTNAASVLQPPCHCNHGVVLYISSASVLPFSFSGSTSGEECVCQCFDEYLLPRCLYKALNPKVSMDLWIAGPPVHERKQREPLEEDGSVMPLRFQDALVQALQRGFGLEKRSINEVDDNAGSDEGEDGDGTFVYHSGWVAATSVTWHAAAAAADANGSVSVVRATVLMPGWAAQHMLADSMHDNLGMFNFSLYFISGFASHYHVVYVADRTLGPLQTPLYATSWIRLYINANTITSAYVSLEQYGWLVGAVILVVVLVCGEYHFMYNVECNVGGGALHVGLHTNSNDAATEMNQAMAEAAAGPSDEVMVAGATSAAAAAAAAATRTTGKVVKSQNEVKHNKNSSRKTIPVSGGGNDDGATTDARQPHQPLSQRIDTQQLQRGGGAARDMRASSSSYPSKGQSQIPPPPNAAAPRHVRHGATATFLHGDDDGGNNSSSGKVFKSQERSSSRRVVSPSSDRAHGAAVSSRQRQRVLEKGTAEREGGGCIHDGGNSSPLPLHQQHQKPQEEEGQSKTSAVHTIAELGGTNSSGNVMSARQWRKEKAQERKMRAAEHQRLNELLFGHTTSRSRASVPPETAQRSSDDEAFAETATIRKH